MAPPTTIYIIGGIEVLNDAGVGARLPLIVSGNVAPATNGRREFHARLNNQIVRICGVVAGYAMTILTLHPFKMRRGCSAGKPGRHVIADRVANQATGIRLLIVLFQRGECLGMGSFGYRIIYRLMAFDTVLPPGVVWGRTRDAEQS